MKKSFYILLFTLILATISPSQNVYEPARESAERTNILSTLRMPVERDLKERIVFVPEHFSVQGSWAFIYADLQIPGGGKPKHLPFIEDGDLPNTVSALLKKVGGRWRVTTYRLGCTDVCEGDWWQRFKAPKAIFPVY